MFESAQVVIDCKMKLASVSLLVFKTISSLVVNGLMKARLPKPACFCNAKQAQTSIQVSAPWAQVLQLGTKPKTLGQLVGTAAFVEVVAVVLGGAAGVLLEDLTVVLLVDLGGATVVLLEALTVVLLVDLRGAATVVVLGGATVVLVVVLDEDLAVVFAVVFCVVA
jgi:hypothetical protein